MTVPVTVSPLQTPVYYELHTAESSGCFGRLGVAQRREAFLFGVHGDRSLCTFSVSFGYDAARRHENPDASSRTTKASSSLPVG
jgi:hypothetical protein